MENTALSDAAKAKRREYFRKWYARNKDKHKATVQRYWERKALEAQQAENNKNAEQSNEGNNDKPTDNQ